MIYKGMIIGSLIFIISSCAGSSSQKDSLNNDGYNQHNGDKSLLEKTAEYTQAAREVKNQAESIVSTFSALGRLFR